MTPTVSPQMMSWTLRQLSHQTPARQHAPVAAPVVLGEPREDGREVAQLAQVELGQTLVELRQRHRRRADLLVLVLAAGCEVSSAIGGGIGE